jgi:hypothetical protein
MESLQSLTRQQKLASAVDLSRKTKYTTLPKDQIDLTQIRGLGKFLFADMDPSFDHAKDTLPPNRVKLIHPVGTVAPVKFVASAESASRFTGLFKGGDSCLARLSTAGSPDKMSFTPGMALKCFIDGNAPSGNIIAMFNLDGQGDNWNFFENVFTNIIEQPQSFALKFLAKNVFGKASHCPTWLSLRQFAVTDQTGFDYGSNLTHPEKIYFIPAGVSFSTTKSATRDFRADLEKVKTGSTLWTVEAKIDQNDPDSARIKLGSIVTTGPFIASSYSDNILFFQHDRGESDGCPDSL